MEFSENGWAADGRTSIASYAVPGGMIPVRKGDVATVLVWCAQRWHATVEPLQWPGCWGYADRNVRGSASVISNHSSGTAIDLNAPAHPRGVPAKQTMTPAKIAACRAIVAASNGVLRWGGDYTAPSLPDAMHFEINAGPNQVAALANQIRSGFTAAPSEEDDLTPDQDARLKNIEKLLGALKPGMILPARSPNARVKQDDAFGMAMNAQAEAADARTAIEALAKKLTAGPVAGPAQLSDADVQRIATAVLNELARRATG
jgi:hypothetical protein